MSTLRWQYERWCKGDDTEDCKHKQQCEVSYQNMVKVLWIVERKLLKWLCVRARAEQHNINHSARGTWTVDFMLWWNETRLFLGKHNLRICWRQKQREIMSITGTILVTKWFAKIKQWLHHGKEHETNRVRGVKNCQKRRMVTSTVLSGWNGDNHHGCPQLLLETSVYQHTDCTNTSVCPASKHKFVTPDKASSMKTLWKEPRKRLSRYAAENRLWKRQQKLKKWSLWKNMKGNPWIRPDNILWKSFLELEAWWHSDWQESSYTIHPRVRTAIWQKWGYSGGTGRWG